MKIYAISGLGADKRVFEYLTLENELISLDWIIPRVNEPIEEYAKRFAENKLRRSKIKQYKLASNNIQSIKFNKQTLTFL